MDTEYLNIKIKNVPPIKRSSEKSVHYLLNLRKEMAKIALKVCNSCEEFMTCNKAYCPKLIENLNNKE